MRIIPSSSQTPTPWKNGGGVTREIARGGEEAAFGWRISIADVERDGAFSLFPGHRRWLAVIAGDGMRLEPESGAAIDVRLLAPVHFSGDVELFGRLNGGPCRDFNLIYDPARFTASMSVVKGGAAISGPMGGREASGVLLLAGEADAGEALAPFDFAMLESDDDAVRLGADACAVRIDLSPVS